MIKNLLLATALLSLALASGCAKGGNGTVPPPIVVSVSTAPVDASHIYPTQSLIVTANVTPQGTSPAVTWSLTGSGTLTPVTPATVPATATYVAPATVGSQGTITATLVSDTTKTGTAQLTVADITTDVSPSTLSIGAGLTQQFTAVAVPDDAPQTFTWTCTAANVQCKNFHQDANVSGLAYYTAQDNCSGACIQISAVAPLDTTGCSANPKNCTIAKASLVTSRVNGTYAFRFSGYDGSNNATAVVGTFTAVNGTITSGVEDELTSNGKASHAITGGSYQPATADPNNSNNAGTLTLNTGAFPNAYQVVLDGNGDLEMIESDLNGSGSGIAQKSASSNLFTGNQTFAFGFTGVDSVGKHIGMAGVLPMNGSGTIVSGQMDVNDNAITNSVCGSSPCNLGGSYSPDPNNAGVWQMTVTSATTMHFDIFISAGTANKSNPLTFFAVSTDPVDSTHPAVSGTMALQDSTQTYNIAAFKGTSISALTGVNGANSNVSLTIGTTDGSGNFSGQFDQNNAGAILSAAQFPPSGSTAYTYAASTTNGRYTFNMLGNPSANPVVAPIPFILYASGANRGFLLDQKSSSVMTGTMNPQGKGSGSFAGTELPGTYAAATTGSGSFNVAPIAANLLLTSQGKGVYDVSGTQYLPKATVTGTYDFTAGTAGIGVGTLTLTAPSAQKFAVYIQDTAGCTGSSPVCAVQDFLMFDTDSANKNPSIIFAQQ